TRRAPGPRPPACLDKSLRSAQTDERLLGKRAHLAEHVRRPWEVTFRVGARGFQPSGRSRPPLHDAVEVARAPERDEHDCERDRPERDEAASVRARPLEKLVDDDGRLVLAANPPEDLGATDKTR